MTDDVLDQRAVEYINNRIDKLESNLQSQIDRRFDSLDKIIAEQLLLCSLKRDNFNIRVTKLENLKERAIGILFLISAAIGIVELIK